MAMHRDASQQPKSLQSSTHKIFQKHLGGQQLLQGIVQTKAVAKVKEANGKELRRVTSCVPKWLGPLALLLALLTMSHPKSPNSTAKIPTVQALLANARSSSMRIGRGAGAGIAMGVVCPGKDLGRWRIAERFMGNMYLQVAQIKMKAKKMRRRQTCKAQGLVATGAG